MAVLPEDDRFHERTDDPYWNESAWFGFQLPDRDTTGFVYFHHRPNMNYSTGGVGFWDPTGDQTYDCRYYDWGDTWALPEGADMFDFTLGNGLTVRRVDPLQSFDLIYRGSDWYQGKGCELELRYEAFMPPHHTGNPDAQSEWGAAKGHYEQPGRVTGYAKLAGETIEIDTFCNRDHSWGTRALRTINRGHFTWGIASEDHAFQVYTGSVIPPEEDLVFGTFEPVLAGWYLKDGEVGTLDSGHISVVERGEDARPLRVEIDARDQLGRALEVEGRAYNNLAWHGYPFLMMWWAGFEWQVDGRVAYGEEQDYHPLQHYRQMIRRRRAVDPAAAVSTR
jgi:hypothetical protein